MALTITVNISDADQKALENDLLDIEAWVQDAVAGKINNCKKRLAREGIEKLKADPDVATIPADDDGIINEIIKRPDYKNRAARDAEEAAAAVK